MALDKFTPNKETYIFDFKTKNYSNAFKSILFH